jgi:hypothetical protein
MLVESGLEIGELCLELSELLLLLGHNRQQCHKGMLDEGRRRCPVGGGDTVWWWYRVHGGSMPDVDAAVKSERFWHPDNGPVNGYVFPLELWLHLVLRRVCLISLKLLFFWIHR